MFATARDRCRDRRVFLLLPPVSALLPAPCRRPFPLSVRGTSLGALRAPAFAACGSREARARPASMFPYTTIGRLARAPYAGPYSSIEAPENRLGNEGCPGIAALPTFTACADTRYSVPRGALRGRNRPDFAQPPRRYVASNTAGHS